MAERGGIMSDLEVQSVAEVAPGLSQWQRIANIFSAPSKTFEDIKRGNKSWWLPFILIVATSYILAAGITYQVGWSQATDNMIHFNPKMEEGLSKLPADQLEMKKKAIQYSMEGTTFATPIVVAALGAMVSLGIWGTINFVFGGRATYGATFVVWMYAALPGIFKALLGTIVLYAGTPPEAFNIASFAPTSLGAFLNPLETNAALYKLASWLDFTSIWSLILLGIGTATVAGVKRSSGYIAVFGWWAIFMVISVGWAAVFG
jgi:hypothetical protein